jgi:hypothetical protein
MLHFTHYELLFFIQVALASWKCKEQTSLLALPLCIPKLTAKLTPEHSFNFHTPLLGKLEMLLS